MAVTRTFQAGFAGIGGSLAHTDTSDEAARADDKTVADAANDIAVDLEYSRALRQPKPDSVDRYLTSVHDLRVSIITARKAAKAPFSEQPSPRRERLYAVLEEYHRDVMNFLQWHTPYEQWHSAAAGAAVPHLVRPGDVDGTPGTTSWPAFPHFLADSTNLRGRLLQHLINLADVAGDRALVEKVARTAAETFPSRTFDVPDVVGARDRPGAAAPSQAAHQRQDAVRGDLAYVSPTAAVEASLRQGLQPGWWRRSSQPATSTRTSPAPAATTPTTRPAPSAALS